MNISENLQILNTAKQDIKAAIIEKGQTVGDNMHEYAEAIDNISGGGDDTDYLCFEAIEDSAVSLSNFGDNAPNIEYSFDKQTWTTWDYDNIDLPAGLKLYFRGDNPNGFCNNDEVRSTFVTIGTLNLYGNIMTLIDKSGISTSIPTDSNFETLFRDNTSIVSTSVKINTALLLGGSGAFKQLYRGCTNLVNANFELSTVLEPQSYAAMFQYCTSLKSVPYLPAKTLVGSSQETGCYTSMFAGCSSLQYIKAEFTTLSTNYSFNWVTGVASTGCFIEAKDATWTTKGTYACPSGWTLITSVS